MPDLNYQTPRTHTPPGEVTCWRDDADPLQPTLVIQIGAALPDRCVICNSPAHGFRQPRSLGENIDSNLGREADQLFNAARMIAQTATRKSARFEIGLCPAHRRTERRNMIVGGILTFLALGILGPATYYLVNHGTVPEERKAGIAAVATAAVLFVAGIAWMALTLIRIRFVRIDDGRMWLSGAGKPFLDSLPPLQSP